jgi:hypothetical protein
VSPADLASAGVNPYFNLTPGDRRVLEHGGERLVITVLAETTRVAGIDTRVVEERETKDGALVEVSRNYFAIHRMSHDVFYFGEDVDMYKDGKVISHDGAWRAGENGAAFGLMMPGQPAIEARYYQEIAPKIAMDRARIVRLDATVKTPAGTFTKCLQTEETTPLEPLAKEAKFYAPGVGLVQDGDLKLVRSGPSPRLTLPKVSSRLP